jgi:molecular chaperone DnaJ
VKVAEAYDVLGLEQGASKEEAKKAFKQKAKLYHPDVCKDSDAEDKFKQVSEAYQVIETGKSSDPEDQHSGWGGGFGISIEDLLGNMGGFPGFGRQQKRQTVHKPDIFLSDTISFRDSVLGCTRELKYHRDTKCPDCNGNGQKALDNGCTKCGGRGMVFSQHGNTFMQSTCPSCHGNTVSQACGRCSSTGSLPEDRTISVNIPAGITNDKNTLKLGAIGNFMGTSMMGEQWSQGYLTVKVEEQAGLKLVGNDVVAEVDISLLEALQGCVKSVPTIDGNKDAIIPERTFNLGEVKLANLGVKRRGDQRIIVHVKYPKDTTKLTETLKEIE